MYARFALICSAVALAAAVVAPAAFAADPPPVELAPGEKIVSHTTTSEKDSQYVVELLSAIKGVKIGADKTTVLVDNGGKTHPIEIDYGSALSGTAKAGASPAAGDAGAAGGTGGTEAAAGSTGGTGSSAGGSGDVGIGQIAGLLLGLTVVSRLIGIVRQLGGGNR